MNKCCRTSSVETNLYIDRRSGRDRRETRFRLFRRPFSPGRRGGLRRRADRRHFILLDRYSPKLLFAVILVLLLSVTDALLTLWLVSLGADELNPVMAFFLDFGPNAFMLAKYLITSASVIIVVLLNYIYIQRIQFQIGDLLHYFAGCFAAVVAWELILIVRHAI